MKIYSLVFSILLLSTTAAYAEEAAPAAAEASAETKLSIKSNAFLDKMAMPTLYTCDGEDASPALSWSDAPAKTAAFALVMSDIDAPQGVFYHWLLFNIPKNVTALEKGAPLPAGAVAGKNNFDKDTYSGPCPPKGKAHTYTITLYALDAKLDIPKNSDGKTILDSIHKHVIAEATLTGVYSRWIQ